MAIHNGIQAKKEKELVVVEAYAIVDPWTMVVHLEYTYTANSAMVGPIRLVLVTPLAGTRIAMFLLLLGHRLTALILLRQCRIFRRYLIACAILPGLWDCPWVHDHCAEVAYDNEGDGHIEDNHMHPSLVEGVSIRQQWKAMKRMVDEPQHPDDREDEEHGEELVWLGKTEMARLR